MIYVLDANILVRLADTTDAMHATTEQATKSLRASGAVLRTLPQSLFEFWVVATRPREKNGIGLKVSDAETFIDLFVRLYWPIPDDPSLVTYWRRLVVRYGVTGKQAHELTHLLTFDADFNRYSAEGITVVNPASIVQ